MKDVVISIKGMQKGKNILEDDSIELVTSGKYCHKEGETVFSYMETEITGLEGTKTTFRITPEQVTLRREGSTNSEMVFQKGKKHLFLYDTEFGSLSMGVNTRKLVTGMGGNGGDMRIDYTLDMDSVIFSKNTFVINVRELPGKKGCKLPQ